MKKKNLKKVPKFKNEDDERKFWATHDTTEYYDLSKAVRVSFPNLKPSTVLTSIRLPAWLLNSIKGIANKKDVPAQSLMKMYLAEKVEEELKTSLRR
ncbi:MAG: BrnA antitoxin family protein [Bacteroidota bacterium]|nr:BrnA antitoxin family protein [Bacteroidota bacterium]